VGTPANIQAPKAVVALFQDSSGLWRMFPHGQLVASPVSIANAQSPLAIALVALSGPQWALSSGSLVD